MKFVRATYRAHPGIIWGGIASAICAVFIGAIQLDSGFGLVADLLFSSLVACIAIPLLALAITVLLNLVRRLPPLLTGFLLSVGLVASLLWAGTPGILLAAVFLVVECTFGAALATIIGRQNRHRIFAWSLLVLASFANVSLFRFMRSDGIAEDLIQIKQTLPAALKVSDPSQPGIYPVKTLYYGSGNSLRRPEFGPSVAIRTHTVDGSAFFKDFDGWKAWIRKRYWGFGMDKLPLNARVFYPEGVGPFPLFLIVHGNHQMSVPSDNGYAYLCELLASRGFIAVSVDENFLNSGFFHDLPRQQPVRGWLLLEHLRLWHSWAIDPKNPFFLKVDSSRIALAGHSRGGEAAATAAVFNRLTNDPDDANIPFHYGYAIKSVIAIAPEDGQYKPAGQWRILEDVNYLTLQGSNDYEVPSFLGSRQYDHVRFTGHVAAFKSELYIYRANHGQFNTTWGRADANPPESWFLNLRPLISGDTQRQVAKLYITGFLETTLHDRTEYQQLFRDYRSARAWLPDTLYVNRFQDQTYKTICSFDEDADVTTTTLPGGRISATGLQTWREARIPFRDTSRHYNGVFLGWKKASTGVAYSIDLPSFEPSAALNLSVAVTEDDEGNEPDGTTDFSIEAESANGAVACVRLSDFATLLPPLAVRFTKLERLERYDAAEPVFQTVNIPFTAFHQANLEFDQNRLRRIRLLFDKSPSRNIIISGIGLSK